MDKLRRLLVWVPSVIAAVAILYAVEVSSRPQPPPVATASIAKQDATLAKIATHEARSDDVASVFRVLPTVKETKRKTTYHPPAAQLPPFPGSPPICNCLTTGAVASVEETVTETGKGSEAINAASKSQASGALVLNSQSSSLQSDSAKPLPPPPKPRWTLGLGLSTQATEPTRAGLAGSVGFRIFNNSGLRLSTDLPLHAPARFSLTWEAAL